MAIAFVGERGAPQGVTGAGIHVLTLSPTSLVLAGNLLVVAVATNGNFTTTADVTDSAGNKWVNTGLGVVNGALLMLYASVLASDLGPSDTISINFVLESGGITYSALLEEFSGILNANVDVSATSASFSVGPSPATSQASELVVATFASLNQTSFAMNAPFTTFPTSLITGANATALGGGFQIVAATGAQSAAATVGGAPGLDRGILATFRGGVATPEQIPPPPLLTR